MKVCYQCKQKKPFDEYYVKRLNRNGGKVYYHRCKECFKERNREIDSGMRTVSDKFIFNCF